MKRFAIDRSQLLFSLRATAASLLALGIGFALKIDSPHWAAITVWVVTQPSRGMTLSKGFYRFLGTCIGALFAIFLIHFFAESPWIFIILLALWVGLTTAFANLVQYFRAYGSMLAGFTAALVGLSVFSQPDQVTAVAQSRIMSIFLGIAVALVIAGFLSRGSSKKILFQTLDLALSQCLQWIGEIFLRYSKSDLVESERKLVTQISSLDELTNYAAAESMQVRRQRRGLHSFLATLFATISAARAVGLHFRKNPLLVEQTSLGRQQVATKFLKISQDLEKSRVDYESLLKFPVYLNDLFVETGPPESTMEFKVLKDRLRHLAKTLLTLFDQHQAINRKNLIDASKTLSFHRDLNHAYAVGLRSALAVFTVGAIWLLSHWSLGPLMVIMTAVNCGIFATSNNPKSGLLIAFRASLVAVVAAFLALQILELGPQNWIFMAVVLAAFLIPGGILVTHPSWSLAGTIFGANFLVFVAPTYPLQAFQWKHFLSLGLGFFAAIFLTFAFFYLVLPTDPYRRSQRMIKDIIRDMERMARATSDHRAFEWETLMYNRVSALIKVLAETGEIKNGVVEGSFAVLDIGQEIIRLQELSQSANLPVAVQQSLRQSLQILSRLSRHPEKAASQLQSESAHIRHLAPDLAVTLNDLSDRLKAHDEFLRNP
jgi:uncharacterized membrane protein YccC